MPLANLDGARIKLDRASRHIDELRSAARAYLESQPFALNQAEEPNGDLVWRVKIRNQVPAEWSAIIGLSSGPRHEQARARRCEESCVSAEPHRD